MHGIVWRVGLHCIVLRYIWYWIVFAMVCYGIPYATTLYCIALSEANSFDHNGCLHTPAGIEGKRWNRKTTIMTQASLQCILIIDTVRKVWTIWVFGYSNPVGLERQKIWNNADANGCNTDHIGLILCGKVGWHQDHHQIPKAWTCASKTSLTFIMRELQLAVWAR